MRANVRPRWLFFAFVCVGTACSSDSPDRASPPAADSAAVADADRAYVEAWLANDPEAVMATLVGDPVIVPSGRDALVGAGAIRGFWFPPDSPATTVTAYEIDQAQVEASGQLGVVRGTFRLAFDYDGVSYESGGTYVTVLRRGTDGRWRVALRSWNDHPS